MQMTSNTSLRWRKSTRSEGKDACVEVAYHHAGAAVRDSKNTAAEHQRVSTAAWRSFIKGVRRGEFDLH